MRDDEGAEIPIDVRLRSLSRVIGRVEGYLETYIEAMPPECLCGIVAKGRLPR